MLRKFEQLANISCIFSTIPCENHRIACGQFYLEESKLSVETSRKFEYEIDIHNHIWLYEMVKAQLQMTQFSTTLSSQIH